MPLRPAPCRNAKKRPALPSRLWSQRANRLSSSHSTVSNPNRLKLAIVSTHPIQYYAPLFRALAQFPALSPRVFFTWSQASQGPVFDPGFQKQIAWDVPLLEGYSYEFVPNVSKHPGSGHFRGIENPTLNDSIAKWGADAILVYGWNLRSHLHAIRHFRGKIPVLFRGDSHLLDARGRWRTLARRFFLRWIYKHVDVAVAVGRNNREYFLWSGMAAENIAFAPHSVDTARFRDATGEQDRRAESWRESLRIPGAAVTFLFAGKFIQKKDPMLLFDAFTGLASDAHLVFVGDGEMEGRLRTRAAGAANVHFLPFQNQASMPAVYRLGDAYVLPSCGPGETWGLAMNEAMASGRCVIASSLVGGARDLVESGATGWIFEARAVRELRETLRTAISVGRDGLHRMGERAQALIDHWSTEASAQGIAAAVRRACERP
jgi:glycosyltransferase involved in cell wall biosynthesis